VRGLQYHVQEWGSAESPKLFMLHGWMDCGATFQYMMPYLEAHYHVIAPDLRGFGETQHPASGYWFADYFADLEVLLNYYAPHGKVDIVGHSMGGNIVLMYAGLRPERVNRVLSLEALGLPPSKPNDAVKKHRRWLDQVVRNEPAKIYPNVNLLRQSIYRGNPSLPDNVIEDLAQLWGKPVPDDDSGAMMLKHDHRHRLPFPQRYNHEDAVSIWSEVQAQVGIAMATNSKMYTEFGLKGRLDEATEVLNVAPEHFYLVENSGHMLHLEQPRETANCLLDFFKS